MEVLLGGFGPTEDATKDTQWLCDLVKSDVEKKTGKDYQEYKAVKYRNEIVLHFVTGTSILIKVHVGGEDYIHLEIYRALLPHIGMVPHTNVKDNQTIDSPLQPFQKLIPEPVSP
ncbi:cystatin-B-like [Perca fluviatilis]|uniref:cystatin-B-like n=1 Tax=Perca fluviatilis TaxID=8168 RepID=UPI001964A6E5|nr:cystatin-B-like [Perca fluviatilis]